MRTLDGNALAVIVSQGPTRLKGRRRMPRRQRRGLIGMLLSIIVAVVIIIGIFAVYNQVSGTASATQTAIFIRQLVPQVSQTFRGNYSGLSNRRAIGSGYVPENWIRQNSIIEDPDGRLVTINVVPGNSGMFSVTFAGGVSEQTCKAVLGALKTERRFVQADIATKKKVGNRALNTPGKVSDNCESAGITANNFVLRFR